MNQRLEGGGPEISQLRPHKPLPQVHRSLLTLGVSKVRGEAPDTTKGEGRRKLQSKFGDSF